MHDTSRSNSRQLSRRSFLQTSLRGVGVLGLGLLGGQAVRLPVARAAGGGADSFGPLLPADENGLRLPPGFRSRIVAVSLQPPIATSSYLWPRYPDGGATFPTGDGGWVYVANSETGAGGVGALRFDGDGTLVDAYSILTGTSTNCAGGPTPWGTWLSCEEFAAGGVWECDPFTPSSQGVAVPTLGTFQHEAAAVDPVYQRVYLTEDRIDGLLYRFTPVRYPDLSAGALEVAEILGTGVIQPGEVRSLTWHPVVNPNPVGGGVQNDTHLPIDERATRYQVPSATGFEGGEGAWFESDKIYFTTKFDNRVWEIDTKSDTIRILYDFATSASPILTGVDNVYASPSGDVYVAEDGGDMQLVALTAGGAVKAAIEIENQGFSEIAGPALAPDQRRLYFSSQRGPTTNGNVGLTYEVTGPFTPASSVPAARGFGSAVLAAILGVAAAAGLRGRTG